MYILKKLWRSKTVKLALAQAVAGILVAVLTEYNEVGAIAVVKSAMDVFLRMETTESIEDK